MLNRAILMGRLVADPELRQTTNGIPVCRFCIAVDRPFSKDRERQADFINIVAWRSSAEFVSKYFNKGKMIIVEGSIQTRNYEDRSGNKRTAVEVIADNVQFGETKSASSQPLLRLMAAVLLRQPLPLSQKNRFLMPAAIWGILQKHLWIRKICLFNMPAHQ